MVSKGEGLDMVRKALSVRLSRSASRKKEEEAAVEWVDRLLL